MKRNLDTCVEVYDDGVKKNQRHTTNEKPNMYKDIYKDNQYFDPEEGVFDRSKYWLSLYLYTYLVSCLLCGVGSASLYKRDLKGWKDIYNIHL